MIVAVAVMSCVMWMPKLRPVHTLKFLAAGQPRAAKVYFPRSFCPNRERPWNFDSTFHYGLLRFHAGFVRACPRFHPVFPRLFHGRSKVTQGLSPTTQGLVKSLQVRRRQSTVSSRFTAGHSRMCRTPPLYKGPVVC